MRSIFPSQFRPTSEEFKTLWEDGLFIIDANVLLNLYRYSPETRKELERSLESIKQKLFIPHQAAKEFLKNRLTVTAGQAEEYTKSIKTITDLSSVLSNKKKHPFLPEEDLPNFSELVKNLVNQLSSQRDTLFKRLTEDEILDFVQSLSEKRTGTSFDKNLLDKILEEGEIRYQNEVPPGYKDGKKDGSGDPYRKFGDLILWKQLIKEAKEKSKSVIFVTDDKKEDWWLEQSGRTIGPRTELREEFISEVDKDFWMYTVDKFIEESARTSNTPVNANVIAEIIEVRQEVKNAEQLLTSTTRADGFKAISRTDMLDRLKISEQWAAKDSEGFVGLSSFIRNYLGSAGFDYASSYDMLHQLQEEGSVEVYNHQSEGHARPVSAIRLIKQDAYSNKPFEELAQMLNDTENART